MNFAKGKTKRILLGLLLCGCMGSSAYAAEDTYTYTYDDYKDKVITDENATYTYTDADGNEHSIAYKTVTVEDPDTTEIPITTVFGNGDEESNYNETVTINVNGEDVTFSVYYTGAETTYTEGISNNNGRYSGTIDLTDIRGDFVGIGETVSGTTEYAGAIYNYGSSSQIGNITAGFINDGDTEGGAATEYGGAIYNGNGATIESITNSYFMFDALHNNDGTSNTYEYGGVISNAQNSKIGKIDECFFAGNYITITHAGSDQETDYVYGGIIWNRGTIGTDAEGEDEKATGITNSAFIGNRLTVESSGNNESSYFYGGVIYNGNNGEIKIISDCVFIDNYVQITTNGNDETDHIMGGVIYNQNTIGDIKDCYFISNTATSDSGIYQHYGEVIYNQNGTIGNIEGCYFLENTGGRGGVIYNNNSSGTTVIDDIKGCYFIGNTATDYAGVIYNCSNATNSNYNATINSIEDCYFEGNSASGVGGVIYCYGSSIGDIKNCYFIENSASSGGAIILGGGTSRTTTIGSINGSYFIKNEASTDGGAIDNGYGQTPCVIEAINDSYFEGNTAGNGGAIYNDGSSSQRFGTIGTTDDDGNATGITGCYFIENEASRSGGAIYNRYYGEIKAIKDSYFEGNTAAQYGGAIYNCDSGVIGDITGCYFIENKADGTASGATEGGAIYNGGSTGTTTIGDISGSFFLGNTADRGGAIYNYSNGIIGDITGSDFENNSAVGSGGAIYNEGTIGSMEGTSFIGNYATSEDGEAAGGAIYNKGTIGSDGEITIGSLIVNYVEGATGAKGGAIYDENSMKITIAGNVSGNYVKVTEEGDVAGGVIYLKQSEDGQTSVTVTGDVTGNHAETASGTAYGGAFYNNADGTLTIGGDISGNYAESGDNLAYGGAIYNSGTVTISGNITGNYARGDTAEGGAIYNAGTVNINIENQDAVISGNYTESGGTQEANVLYGTADSVTNFSLTDASLTLEDSVTGETGFKVNVTGNGTDATTFYMYNDILDSNLSFDSTTINTINNEVKAYSVNKLSIKGNVNFVADVDMANETMDRFTASEYGEHAGKLNVSGMNLISDTEADSVDIYFAEEGLKDSVTSSVGTLPDSKNQQKAYTPLYQYNVAYDNRSDGGYFTFDKAGNNPSADVPEEGEAAAISFMNLMYRYAFEHSDYYMKLPKKVRLAIMKGEEGDVEKEFKNYNGHNLTDPGIWVKPFASNETVPFSHQFTARTKNYGLLVGIDTAFKEKGKWANVFTGYAGYDGIKQTFDGNSTEQYGGVIGVTDTLYKGNFYAALTLSGGENVLKAKTMYGREKTHLYMAGAAVKTGYNLEFAGGNYSFLPTFMASYTYADIKDYTSASGLKMDSDGMHAVELNPNFKFIRNLNNGWMPYVTVGEIWTVGQHSKVKASGTELDELTFRPYTEYGLGVQKMWSKGYDGYAEFLGHAGGRRGFLINLGFRWTF